MIRIPSKRVSTKKLRRGTPEALRETLPPVITVPDKPIYANTPEERSRYEEQQVARVELLMVKGIRSRRHIMTLLEIDDPRACDRFIERVQARWDLIGTDQDYPRHRGEALVRLDLMESELWSKLQSVNDVRLYDKLINTLLIISDQRSSLRGLSPKVIERIGSLDGEAIEFTRSVQAHDRLSKIAARMLQLIAQRTPRTIEHVETLDEDGKPIPE